MLLLRAIRAPDFPGFVRAEKDLGCLKFRVQVGLKVEGFGSIIE